MASLSHKTGFIRGVSLVAMASLSHKPDVISKEIHNVHQLIILGGALEGDGRTGVTDTAGGIDNQGLTPVVE